jgi:sugar fermentation stimulation protein A
MICLYPALLRKRYKRFLADIVLPDGRELTIHCPNTGSMKNCVVPDSPCWYSVSDSKTRKYPHTLELVTTPGNHIAGINTARANELVELAIRSSVISSLHGYTSLKREQVYGHEKSRIDFLLSEKPGDSRLCYVEVKNVTLMETEGEGIFPDAISERGSKHLRELIAMVKSGHRAALLFCVQHTGIKSVQPADHIDKLYGSTLREAKAAGVELLAYAADILPQQNCIALAHSLPVEV